MLRSPLVRLNFLEIRYSKIKKKSRECPSQFIQLQITTEANYNSRDKLEVEWIKSYYQVCQGLVSYVKLHFPTGITWNVRGGLVETVMGLS